MLIGIHDQIKFSIGLDFSDSDLNFRPDLQLCHEAIEINMFMMS